MPISRDRSCQLIEQRSDGAISFHVSSLYPMLYRLEKRGIIAGRWVERAGQRRRRYYRLTPEILLKPLPWPEPERLVRLEERREGRSGRLPWTISNRTDVAWRDSPSSTIEEIRV